MFPEFVHKADVSIRDNGYRGAVKTVDLSDEDNVNDREADQIGKRITTQAVSDLRRQVSDLLKA